MPIKIPNGLPAAEMLLNENIFVMNEIRAESQDIRPLKIVLLNLMPTKIRNKGEVKGSNDAIWQFGLCDKYDVLVKNQMLTTITPLLEI